MTAKPQPRVATGVRSAPAFPLALGAVLLTITVATLVVVAASSRAQGGDQLAYLGEWLNSLCGTGLLVGINVAFAAAMVDRRGAPQRFVVALLAAVVVFYLGSFLLSWAREPLMKAWMGNDAGRLGVMMYWLPLVSLVQMMVVAWLGLLLAWRVGGGGVTPTIWHPGARRMLGSVVAFGACIGVVPLQGRLIGMLELVPMELLANGLPWLALVLGVVLGLAWLIAPMRQGPGVWPPFVSALLVGPLLLLVAMLSRTSLLKISSNDVLGLVALALLLACPLLAWFLSRLIGHRLTTARTSPAT